MPHERHYRKKVDLLIVRFHHLFGRQRIASRDTMNTPISTCCQISFQKICQNNERSLSYRTKCENKKMRWGISSMDEKWKASKNMEINFSSMK